MRLRQDEASEMSQAGTGLNPAQRCKFLKDKIIAGHLGERLPQDPGLRGTHCFTGAQSRSLKSQSRCAAQDQGQEGEWWETCFSTESH